MRRRQADDDWPPALVILAGVGAFMGVIPGLLFGAFVLLTGGIGLFYASNPVIALVCVVYPWLLVVGAVRLMAQRSRWLLISAGLPVTAFAGWVLLHDGQAWQLLLLLGPALAPLFALAPSVGRWLAARPFRVA
jgi:hypothetical protein